MSGGPSKARFSLQNEQKSQGQRNKQMSNHSMTLHQKTSAPSSTEQWASVGQGTSLLRFSPPCLTQPQNRGKIGADNLQPSAQQRLRMLAQLQEPPEDFWQNREALCSLLGCFCSLNAWQRRSLLAALAFAIPQINHVSELGSVAVCICLECR